MENQVKNYSTQKEEPINIPDNSSPNMGTPSHPTPKFLSKRMAVITILFLSLIILVGFFTTIYYLTNTSKPTSQVTISKTPSPDPNSTANWKTYTSKTFNAFYPQDWSETKTPISKYEPDIDEDVEFKSPDYEENAVHAMTNGAKIIIFKRPITNNQSLNSFIESKLAAPNRNLINTLKKVTYGNTTYHRLFNCWEGCSDTYYLESKGAFYSITFQCSPNCESKQEIDKNRYAKTRDVFLEKVNFNYETK